MTGPQTCHTLDVVCFDRFVPWANSNPTEMYTTTATQNCQNQTQYQNICTWLTGKLLWRWLFVYTHISWSKHTICSCRILFFSTYAHIVKTFDSTEENEFSSFSGQTYFVTAVQLFRWFGNKCAMCWRWIQGDRESHLNSETFSIEFSNSLFNYNRLLGSNLIYKWKLHFILSQEIS